MASRPANWLGDWRPDSCAMQRVLAVPELFEAILLQLDMATLLTKAQQVNRHWKESIATSPKLQQALFFRAVPAEDDPDTRAAAIINPLLVKHFGKCFFDLDGLYDHPDLYKYWGIALNVLPTPRPADGEWGIYHRAMSFSDLPWSGGHFGTPKKLENLDCPWYLTNIDPSKRGREMRDRFTRHGSSWRRMLISQPPPRFLGYMNVVLDGLSAPRKTSLSKALIDSRADNDCLGLGVRMGLLYDMVQNWVGHPGRDNSTAFRVTWRRPRKPTRFDASFETSKHLLERTSVVLELYRWHDDGDRSGPMDPYCESTFDTAFRSADCQVYDVTTISDTRLLASDLGFKPWLSAADVVSLRSWYGWGVEKFQKRSGSATRLRGHETRLREICTRDGYHEQPIIVGRGSVLTSAADVKTCCRMEYVPKIQRTRTLTAEEKHPLAYNLEDGLGDWVDICDVGARNAFGLRMFTRGEYVRVWWGGKFVKVWQVNRINFARF